LRLLVVAATAEGVDLNAWLTPLGLEAAVLARRDAPVPLAFWRQMMLSLQRLPLPAGLAMRLGRRVPLIAHGPLAYLMASSGDLRQALDALVRFAPLRLAVLNVQLRQREQGLELQVRPRVSLGDVERFTLDFLLAMLCTMLEGLCAGACQAVTLHLPGTQSDTVRSWAEQGIRVRKSTGRPFLLLPDALAVTRLTTASAREHLRAWQACEDAEREHGWSASIGSRIEQLFRTGPASNYQLAEIARHLGISRRTVMRRLIDEGTSFSALVDTSRKQRLVRRLAERPFTRGEWQLTMGEIADDLGYADGAVLSRAARRWFGISPRALQRRLVAGLAAPVE
jgi:AraC-like DNA-binding protein